MAEACTAVGGCATKKRAIQGTGAVRDGRHFRQGRRVPARVPIVSPKDRAIAEGVLYRRSPTDNAGPWIDVEGRQVLQFSTNDYLGLARHPKVRQAAVEAVAKYGVSAPWAPGR